MLRLNYKRNETLMAFKSPMVFKEGMKRPILRNSTNVEIGARMRLVRLAHVGYDNASEYAREFGWSAQRYAQYEKGTNKAPIEVLTAIEGLTGIGMPWLLRGETRGSDFDILSKIQELEALEADPAAPRIPKRRVRSAVS